MDLATIRSVSPDVVEPGDRLIVEGEGFVEGDVRLALSGVFDPAGMKPPREERVVLNGKALSQTRIE